MHQTREGLVAAGIGVTFVPESVQPLVPPSVVCRPIEGSNLKLELAVGWRKDDSSPVLREFLKVVKESIHQR